MKNCRIITVADTARNGRSVTDKAPQKCYIQQTYSLQLIIKAASAYCADSDKKRAATYKAGALFQNLNTPTRERAVKTKDRIVKAALELFNQHGERSVTTNHIAAHIKISPGNLYYHYRNKSDIIARIFDEYEATVAGLFSLPQTRDITLEDRAQLTEKLLALIWEYRFMHRDLVGMLANDPELKARYQSFADSAIANTEHIYRRMRDSGFMQISDTELEPLALNIWILITSWTTYLRTARGISEEQLTRQQLYQVIYQMTYLEMPYLTEATREETQHLLTTFGPDSSKNTL